MPADFPKKFTEIGGQFLTPAATLQKKINNLKGFIFDWDGVFNDGIKIGEGGSPFSEIDSMGINMLRFGYYLKFGFIPAIYIVTGENNPAAWHLSAREHFQAVYLKAKVKTAALEHLLGRTANHSAQLAFTFDDILDLGLAAEISCGFYIGRPANPLLNTYVQANQLADYLTGNTGGQNPVREICELCLAALGNYDEVVALRVANDEKYQAYLKLRNQLTTSYYRYESDGFEKFENL